MSLKETIVDFGRLTTTHTLKKKKRKKIIIPDTYRDNSYDKIVSQTIEHNKTKWHHKTPKQKYLG